MVSIPHSKMEFLIEPQYGSISNPDFFVSPEYVKYRSYDGLEIAALLYKPRTKNTEKAPALVMVHGGPTAQFFHTFSIIGQILTNKGFVLLQPNVRGSTGYGKEFQDKNIMDWGGGDLEDVAAGAKYLKILPFVDKSRIGVFGGSYGGFMTFLQITKKPELWDAACAWIGISHLKTFYKCSLKQIQILPFHLLYYPIQIVSNLDVEIYKMFFLDEASYQKHFQYYYKFLQYLILNHLDSKDILHSFHQDLHIEKQFDHLLLIFLNIFLVYLKEIIIFLQHVHLVLILSHFS